MCWVTEPLLIAHIYPPMPGVTARRLTGAPPWPSIPDWIGPVAAGD